MFDLYVVGRVFDLYVGVRVSSILVWIRHGEMFMLRVSTRVFVSVEPTRGTSLSLLNISKRKLTFLVIHIKECLHYATVVVEISSDNCG